ncbi:MAG: poly-gamma-glutamate system protein [Candidatus Accumulibacter sp.]|jgi:poly-gamma-glutamate system protein|nr:poly-gamma-glutamate system protein [Accumulibacter sp.]
MSKAFFHLFSSAFRAPDYAPALRCPDSWIKYAVMAGLLSCIAVEAFHLPRAEELSMQEAQAVSFMRQATREIGRYREELGIPIDPALDPNRSGLIGFEYSDMTTTEGSIKAKRTSLNPAFAALVVRLLRKAGVQTGDRVAVAFTGSFPALNIAALSACRALGLQPQIISSVGASSFGANIPGLTWLDMERRLVDAKIMPFRASAISLGGIVETGGGLDGNGFLLAREAMRRHGAPILDEGDFRVVERDMLRRREIFERHGPVAAFINVGGALTSLGWVPEAAKLDMGLLEKIPATSDANRGLIFRYFEAGIPVIHLLNVVRLAERHALPVDPVPLPEDADPHRHLRRLALCALILSVWAVASVMLLKNESTPNPQSPHDGHGEKRKTF